MSSLTTSPAPRRGRSLPRSLPRSLGRAGTRLAAVPRLPRLHSRAPRVPFVSLVSLLLLAGVVGLLLFNTSMQQASFTASRLDDEASVLAARQQALTTELDELRNPSRLAARACALGMVAAPTAAFLDVDSGRVTGQGAAAPAAAAGACPGASSVTGPGGVR